MKLAFFLGMFKLNRYFSVPPGSVLKSYAALVVKFTITSIAGSFSVKSGFKIRESTQTQA